MNFEKMTTPELEQFIEQQKAATSDSIRLACKALGELLGRGQYHPAVRGEVYKWYKQINAGTLDVDFVMMFAGDNHLIRSVVGSPIEAQQSWARGDAIKVAETNAKNEVVVTEKPLVRFDRKDLDAAFENGKLRAVPEQKKVVQRRLNATPAPKPEPKATITVSRGDFVVAGRKFSKDDLARELDRLGYMLISKQGVVQSAKVNG